MKGAKTLGAYYHLFSDYKAMDRRFEVDISILSILRAMMFAHEASFDCVFCGTHFCYGECRSDGTEIVYGGDKRNMEVVPTVQATPIAGDGLRDGQESDGRPTRTLPEMPTELPFTTKAYTRYRLPSRYNVPDPEFNTVRTMEYF